MDAQGLTRVLPPASIFSALPQKQVFTWCLEL